MKTEFLSFTMALAILGFASACNSSSTPSNHSDKSLVDNSITDTLAAAEPGIEVGGAMMVPSKNIVENAMGSTDHATLVSAVKAAGLVETLSGPGPFTVFAPTNAAFDMLPVGAVENLLKPEKKDELTKVLTYHIVPGSYKSMDLKNGLELMTVQGQKIILTEKDGKWWVNDAEITIADVVSSNGVTFVIDKVLMPK